MNDQSKRKKKPKITILNTNISLEATPVVSVLNTLLKNDIRISHVCGGKLQCGTCRMEIVEGASYANSKSEEEMKKLKNTDPHIRLACQAYVYGPVVIKIPSY